MKTFLTDTVDPCNLVNASPETVCVDSRLIKEGDLFVAIPCDSIENNIGQAVRLGASTIILEHDLVDRVREQFPSIQLVPVKSSRLALAKLASFLYGKQPSEMMAVTGTNGKSSVVNFVRQIWEYCGHPSVSLGTLGIQTSVVLPNDLTRSPLTTPDPLSLHRILNGISASGVDHCIFEASSHGLDQYRLHGVRLRAAGFTNLTQDHLDYHGTMEEYFAAKSKLFTEVLAEDGVAVVNADSPYFESLKKMVIGRGQKLLSYKVNGDADLCAHNIRLTETTILFDLQIQGERWSDVSLTMVGSFQVENILCAIGLALASGESVDRIVESLSYLKSAVGRMEFVGQTAAGGSIFIDYAHTPDALARALQALRLHVPDQGRLSVVFGCGGNRDAGKRSQMGKLAADLADTVVVTDDNPRNEDPAFIRAQILVGCPKAQEISGRKQAIEEGIKALGAKDVLLIAGKGHEQGQLINGKIQPFDDGQVVRSYLGIE